MSPKIEKRGNVRTGLAGEARVSGTDSRGRSFYVGGQSVDFSRNGLGLIVNRNIISPGAEVSVELPRRLSARAIVQWVAVEPRGKKARIGIRLINPRSSLRFRILSCVLILWAALSQAAAGKTRWGFVQPSTPARCKVGAQQMMKVIGAVLTQPQMITEAEKEFVRVQHEHLSCSEYTRLFEQSNYFKSPGKREAMIKWHREVYHSQGENGPEHTPQGTEIPPTGNR